MNRVTLQRVESGDEGTFGLLSFGALTLHSGELPSSRKNTSSSCRSSLGKTTDRLRAQENSRGVSRNSASSFMRAYHSSHSPAKKLRTAAADWIVPLTTPLFPQLPLPAQPGPDDAEL